MTWLTPARRRAALTAGLALLGALQFGIGAWAWFAPAQFFEAFPGFGQRWTAAYPPYNAHLVTDLGATFVTLGVLLLIAAVLRDHRVTTVVLVGVLVFAMLHLAFHATHHGLVGGGQLATSIAFLVLGVLAPAALLLLARRPHRR